MQPLCITVVGAGITGLWQALTLARRGHRVRLLERSSQPFAQAASSFAGAMLAPYCEAEATPPVVHELGLRSLALWRETYPAVVEKHGDGLVCTFGSHVVTLEGYGLVAPVHTSLLMMLTLQKRDLVADQAGGRHALGNLTLLCRFHHLVAIHRWGWVFTLKPDGTTTAVSPDGTKTLYSHPPPVQAA